MITYKPLFKDNKYYYKDINITPQIIIEIIFFKYKNDDNIYQRQKLFLDIVNFHLDNGGLKNEKNGISALKRALQCINTNYVENVSTGNWRFKINENISFNNFFNPKKRTHVKEEDRKQETVHAIKNDVLKGDGWVYFYYFPSYKELAFYKKEGDFPIKIGKSKNHPKFRVNEQSGTSLPEKPVIFLEVKSNDCSNLEKHIHSHLTLLNKKNTNAVGTEWFLSNELTLISIINNMKSAGIDLDIKIITPN